MSRRNMWIVAAVVVGGAVTAAALIYANQWFPWSRAAGDDGSPVSLGDSPEGRSQHADEHDHAHDGHDHGHGHDAASSIELSSAALKNIGYQPYTVQLVTFERTVTLPAMVVERPGRSQVHVTAPMTGVVTKVFPTQGAAIEPGRPLFEIRLTHDELVAAQREFLRTAESLDVLASEIRRLQDLSDGVIAGKRVLEQEYERQKLMASLRAERQALLLHGLSEKQIQNILDNRELLSSLTVYAPDHHDEEEACSDDHWYHVQNLPIYQGEHVEAGQVLCILADHCELYIEGRAYEDDAQLLRQAVDQGYTLKASLLVGQRRAEVVNGLRLLYLADKIDPSTRAFYFYLPLTNNVLLSRSSPSGQRFIEWRFKPGQRMELQVPVQRLQDQIVLPSSAVVEDGAETYVYQQNGDHFDRVPVHVLFRDAQQVAIASDGALFPGDVVAAQGAYQMHLALRNKSGAAIDPHAGHNH